MSSRLRRLCFGFTFAMLLGAPHCWGPSRQELMQKMVAQIEKVAPAGADLKSWRY